MKINALEYFVALSEAKSINEAAQKLYISQPSLTKALQQLETELGVKLFLRSVSGIELTEAGKSILPEAKQVIAYYNGWKQLGHQALLHGINVYASVTVSDFLLPDVIRQFRKTHPDLPISYIETKAQEKIGIEKWDSSLSITVDNESMDIKAHENHLMRFLLCRGSYTCLISKNSSLVNRSVITPEDLKNYYLATVGFDKSKNDSPIFHMLQTVPSNRIIQVVSPTSIIKTLLNDPETYTIAYYPALYRYKETLNGELTFLPFDAKVSTAANVVLLCSRQSYQQYPLMRELVKAIRSAYADFSSDISVDTRPT